MASIFFGNKVDMIIAATPSSGSYLVAYDLDGILKQKDEFGVITIIGGTGSQGAQGVQGEQGVQGAQGFQGHQGFQGVQGFQGRQGNQGFQGNQGVQGFQGDQGDVGGQGFQGDQGFQGAQGNQGFQGEQGIGAQGFQGAQGDQGFQGATGPEQNFANTNLTFTGNRSHDTNGNYLEITTDNSNYEEAWLYLDRQGASNLGSWIGYGDNYIRVAQNYIGIYDGISERLKFDSNTDEIIFNENGSRANIKVKGNIDLNLLNIQVNGPTSLEDDLIGIGITPSYKLHVIGTVSTTGFRMTDGAQNGYVLTSDASGNAAWITPSSTITKSVVIFTPGTAGSPNTINHSIDSDDLLVQLYEISSGDSIIGLINNITTTTLDITFGTNPTGDIKAVIIG
jgi:hypothetical protein